MSEYEEMKQTIEDQKQVIEIFKTEPNVVLIDERRSPCGRNVNVSIPYIVSTDHEQAKEYLKKEFHLLKKHVNELDRLLEVERSGKKEKQNHKLF